LKPGAVESRQCSRVLGGGRSRRASHWTRLSIERRLIVVPVHNRRSHNRLQILRLSERHETKHRNQQGIRALEHMFQSRRFLRKILLYSDGSSLEWQSVGR